MLTAGILVGGQARRMGGVAKGLLPHPSEPGAILDHVVRQVTSLGAKAVLVGDHPAYRHLGLDVITDAVEGIGPAGGVLALLRYAHSGIALTMACDMPYVTASLILELLERVERGAPAAAFRRQGRLETLCATYDVGAALVHVEACVHAGTLGLFRVMRAVGAVEIDLSAERSALLDDWDTHADVVKARNG